MKQGFSQLLYIPILLLFFGCTTVDIKSVKNWSDDKIYQRISWPYNTKPKHLVEQDWKIMRQVLIERHPEWSEEEGIKILKGEAFLGMNQDQALAVFGAPSDIKRTITGYGSNEQWIYENSNFSTIYIYFKNGLLTTIQN